MQWEILNYPLAKNERMKVAWILNFQIKSKLKKRQAAKPNSIVK